MIDNIEVLLEKNVLVIFETLPSACLVLIDPVGYWDITDFDVAWCNSAAKRLLGDTIASGKIKSSSEENLSKRIEHSQSIRQKILTGHKGLIGPFSLDTLNAEKGSVHIDYYVMHLGEIGSDISTFLVTIQEKNP